MAIIEIKARKIFACAGSWAWLAEALVTNEKGEDVYVAVHYYDGENYTVCRQSIYDYLAGDGEEPACEFLEEYENSKDAKKSAYAKVFDKLRKVIDMLG